MFVDETDVTISAGDGGEGKISFGKFERSGPDGGNGGDGGDVYIVGSSDLTLLGQFRSKRVLSAENGGFGGKNKCTGKNGDDLTLNLPTGSVLTDKKSKDVFELKKVGQKILLCLGGNGGIGNYDLRSSRNTTPKTRIPATKGQKRKLAISLRFIADFGLVGLPSAGKSSLLNELTNSNVKTAAYHFTTLSANLGVLPNKNILADIPGLIEGASTGKGLGIKFLKHIQRVGLILHCISSESLDPLKDYEIVRKEMESFNKELLDKREVIIITKQDLINKKRLEEIVNSLSKLDRKIVVTSIHDAQSLQKLYKLLN